jgi:uncharacterized protein YxjI
MEIDINQKRISIGDKYQIFIDGIQAYHAAAKIFRLFAEINLFDLNSDFSLVTIKRKFAFFTAKYDITKKDGNVYQFVTKSFWKGHFNVSADPICMIFMRIAEENILLIKTTNR